MPVSHHRMCINSWAEHRLRTCPCAVPCLSVGFVPCRSTHPPRHESREPVTARCHGRACYRSGAARRDSHSRQRVSQTDEQQVGAPQGISRSPAQQGPRARGHRRRRRDAVLLQLHINFDPGGRASLGPPPQFVPAPPLGRAVADRPYTDTAPRFIQWTGSSRERDCLAATVSPGAAGKLPRGSTYGPVPDQPPSGPLAATRWEVPSSPRAGAR